ncbi:MAG: hypothetical protein ACREN8_01160, partial [Candidatus Dormibacteraceae bacterium]
MSTIQAMKFCHPGSWVESWLSVARFSTYLQIAGKNRHQALELYEWNTAISAAFLHDLAHLEVALRNAYDRVLVSGISAGQRHWTLEPTRYFQPIWRKARNGALYDSNRILRQQIEQAVATAGHGAPSGKIIAELMFSFWRYLSSGPHEKMLWVPYLHQAFITGTKRTEIDRRIRRLHQIRNRVVHHE